MLDMFWTCAGHVSERTRLTCVVDLLGSVYGHFGSFTQLLGRSNVVFGCALCAGSMVFKALSEKPFCAHVVCEIAILLKTLGKLGCRQLSRLLEKLMQKLIFTLGFTSLSDVFGTTKKVILFRIS